MSISMATKGIMSHSKTISIATKGIIFRNLTDIHFYAEIKRVVSKIIKTITFESRID